MNSSNTSNNTTNMNDVLNTIYKILRNGLNEFTKDIYPQFITVFLKKLCHD